jgi:hypothetical protein
MITLETKIDVIVRVINLIKVCMFWHLHSFNFCFLFCFTQCVSVSIIVRVKSFTFTHLYIACKNSVSDLHLHLHCFYRAKNYLHNLTLTHFKFINYSYTFCDATHTLT